MDPDVALTYLDFVVERHRVWERRRVAPGPWTDDPVLRSRKFTNVYRAIDHGSQFLIRELLTPDLDPRDAMARCFLYRYTNLPETWQVMREGLGRYPLADDLTDNLVTLVHQHRDSGQKVFSGAYVILPQPGRKGDKVAQAVALASRFINEKFDEFLEQPDQASRFRVLRSLYGVGDFLAMQILTDWGYSPQCGVDREDDFVVPGPGCVMGAKFIDPDAPVQQTLMWAVDAVRSLPDVPLLDLPNGNTRVPSWMDIQNTLCEYSKYHRYAAKEPRLAPYVPAHPGASPDLVLPSHW